MLIRMGKKLSQETLPKTETSEMRGHDHPFNLSAVILTRQFRVSIWIWESSLNRNYFRKYDENSPKPTHPPSFQLSGVFTSAIQNPLAHDV
jgi:hypothetical protein